MVVGIVQEKFNAYQCQTVQAEESAIKEICQEIILAGLARSGFFMKAAFQGGTCLRIFYRLPRFSEDLDFMLREPDETFAMHTYLENALKEIADFGFEFELFDRSKAAKNMQIAFIKSDSFGKVLSLRHPLNPKSARKINIKIEIDIRPPSGSLFEVKYLDFPFAFPVTVQDQASLFAGKVHALLCRPYCKGRDWFDFTWYTSRRSPVNFTFLAAALEQMGPWQGQTLQIDRSWLVAELTQKISTMDWMMAKKDVERFVEGSQVASLAVWGQEYFMSCLEKIL